MSKPFMNTRQEHWSNCSWAHANALKYGLRECRWYGRRWEYQIEKTFWHMLWFLDDVMDSLSKNVSWATLWKSFKKNLESQKGYSQNTGKGVVYAIPVK